MNLNAVDPRDPTLFDRAAHNADPLNEAGWDPWRAHPEDGDLRILVLGTSISWGQGLNRDEKFAHLVARALVNRRVCRRPVIVSYAHSGARIWDEPARGLDNEPLIRTAPSSLAQARARAQQAPARYAPARRNTGEGRGECPKSPAHIWTQAAAAAKLFERSGTRPDLVLLDGGANDFGFMAIVAPGTPGAIHRQIANLGGAMEALIRAIATHPHLSANIVVSGYFQPFTSSFALGNLPGAAGNPPRMPANIFRLSPVMPALTGFVTPALVQTWVTKAATFRRDFNGEPGYVGGVLKQDVARAGHGVFADPGFGEDDGLLSPETKLWGPNRHGEPWDHAMDDRANHCLPFHTDAATYEVHARASFGHPNPAGAELYARAILTGAKVLM